MKDKIIKIFGYYEPTDSVRFLQVLIKIGISRGAFRKWIVKQWRKKGNSIVDTTVRGINYRLHINSNTTDEKVLTSSKYYDKKEIFSLMDGVIESSEIDVLAEKIFIDVGANTGYYSLNLASLGYSKVIAIEPNPPTLDILKFNISANNFESKIVVMPVCIGNGEDVLFYTSSGLGSASVFKEHHNSEPIKVLTMPLLEILKKNGIKQIQGMKIDIEGFEDRALFPFFESAPRTLWPLVLVIEVCHESMWKKNILNKLESIGYVIIAKTRGNKILKLLTNN